MTVLQNKVIISLGLRNEKLETLFTQKKAVFLSFPTIETKPKSLSEPEIEILNNISNFDYLIFTSKSGVQFFFDQIKKHNISLSKNTKTVSIGKETSQLLEKFGLSPEIDNQGSTSLDLIACLKSKNQIFGKKILLITGNLAKNSIAESMKGIADVERIDVYSTQIPEQFDPETLNRIQNKNYDWIIFTSPSTFSNILKISGFTNLNQFRKIAVIGRITENAILEKGFTIDAVAEEASPEGIVQIIEKFETTHN